MKYADNDRIFKVLDFLSSTPWKINREVLDIV
jgi:DNA-directed RNA polymerase